MSYLQTISDAVGANKEIAAAIISSLLSAIGFAIARSFTAKSKIQWSPHSPDFFNVITGENNVVNIRTQHVWLGNVGRATANRLEIALNYPPEHLEIWPHILYEIKTLPKNRTVLCFDRLNAGETIRLSMLDSRFDIPNITSVRWDGGTGKRIELTQAKVFSRPFVLLLYLLWAFGILSLVYASVRVAIAFLAS